MSQQGVVSGDLLDFYFFIAFGFQATDSEGEHFG